MLLQRTISNQIKAEGIGLHSGGKILLKVLPAEEGTGIRFRRVDLDEAVEIEANVFNVGDTVLSTTLVRDGVRISTVEHLLSACAGLGLDNIIFEVNGPEIPIMDGSAAPFVFLLQSAGIIEQGASKKFLRIKKDVRHEEKDGAWAMLRPFEGFRITYTLLYDYEVMNRYPSTVSVDFSLTSFLKDVSRARTFGFYRDMQKLKQSHRGLGASLANAVAIDDDGIRNKEGLRSHSELAMHKVLDAIGDLYLLGHNLIGEFIGYKSGHTLNNKLLRKLLAEEDALEVVQFDDENLCPISLRNMSDLLVSKAEAV